MAARFSYRGGHPALDFANTLAWRRSAEPDERLSSYERVLEWARGAGLLDGDALRALARAAGRDPASARRALRRAVEARDLVGRLFDAAVEGRRPAARDLDLFSRRAASAARGARLSWTGAGFAWRRGDARDLAAPVDLVVRSAADLLTSPESARVSRCEDDRGCGWLFLDRSRSGRRRWCSMQDCGNRAKARRHYRRASRRASGRS